ncbi:hypothetical protein CDD81_6892 [Ophiocordyceps australis]|uniref:Major facilitator superfamily (MFS) profile domain-containing protein n=1 Tax=Ophiocordyceps australis TaxID=1399860 RepID=A0A2C5Y1L5_9HYPO|nr:hypothetical protein CDD81_6892 [Ophiocordyceps australis]
MPSSLARLLPFSPSTTPTQAVTYLLGISLFSISFLVFLNSSVSFVITDLIGQKHGVGDVVGTLGFVDELVALVACPAWGLVSDRLGVRWVATLGYSIIAVALAVFVQAKNVYPQLLLARLLFAVGASAAATMVTAILPSLTHESDDGVSSTASQDSRAKPNPRLSAAYSVESEATITPERYTRSLSAGSPSNRSGIQTSPSQYHSKPSALAGLVGLFTGCGALVALALFLPLPARFGELDGVTPGQAVSYSFYSVAAVSLLVAIFVFVGLRNLRGEDAKGWRVLLSMGSGRDEGEASDMAVSHKQAVIPYLRLVKDSVILGFTDSQIALGYIGGFVARASTVAISLFIPLYVNTFFISNGYCQGSPNDPSPELKKECRAAYVLSSILTGVAQLAGLLCAPIFGYLSGRSRRINFPIVIATVFGLIGYIILPRLPSPEMKNEQGRGGGLSILVVVALIGVSQIGAIVCSLGSLGQGVLHVVDRRPRSAARHGVSGMPDDDEVDETDPEPEAQPLIGSAVGDSASRVRLKGSIAGVYSLCGGAAILILTKLGGILFDRVSQGAPFYMMAVFNGVLLAASLLMDASKAFSRT